jgi:hypothetical protein
MSATAEDDLTDHTYFQAVEKIFVDLRGAPLLLSPADWRVAQRWHRDGVPIELVKGALERLFERRRERGTKGRVSSLRYCAPVVEAAWQELRDLVAGGERAAPEPFRVGPRLQALAAALPAGLAGREALAERIAALVGDAQSVEEELAGLDREMLQAALAGLSAEGQAELAAAVGSSLARLQARLPDAEIEEARQRLIGQLLRRRLGLPLLSLFSPEAEPVR